jgi:cellulose biosynthesis protein BcsQ
MERGSVRERGIVYTFYSYKGGVGRTMALANVATLLAKWGRSVLVVDWDLEAPGIERFFLGVTPTLSEQRRSKPGIVDLISAKAEAKEIDWSECLLEAYPPESSVPVSILSAGRNDEHYTGRVQALNFVQLFAERGLGAYIEKLRDQWASRFEFVLIDSRTGITDIGGICTIHLPDVLVLLFTTTDPSVNGVIEVVERAREEQARLPFDRQRLIAVPIPAKDESRTEYERATKWKRLFADRFADLYKDWLPADRTPADALELLRIPYIPYWSFGEPLPVVEEGTSDPMTLGFAYQLLARLIAAGLEWHKALSGEFLATPVARFEREWNQPWLESHRERARQGLAKTGGKGFMEIRFYSPNAVINRVQDELLTAAKRAEIHTFGWPIGVVLDNRPELRPRPTGEGIVADIKTGHAYDYWTLTKQGDFYGLMSLFEDRRVEGGKVIFFNIRIVRVAEALLYCSRLYRALGANGNSLVRFGLRHGGLKGRELTATENRAWLGENTNLHEDEVDTEIQFLLGTLESQLVDLVQKLCEPLFMVFDFARFERSIYADIVGRFLKGEVT